MRFRPGHLAIVSGIALLLASLSAPAAATSIPLNVKEPTGVTRINDPVTTGVPIARSDTALTWRLLQGSTEIPVQTKVLPGMLTPWLLLDFQSSPAASGSTAYTLVSGTPTASANPALSVTDTGSTITVVTGPLKVVISRTTYNFLDQVWFDRDHDAVFSSATEQVVTATATDNLPLKTADGSTKLGRRTPTRVLWEDSGPLRATLRVDGYYGRSDTPTDTLLRYTTRITFFAGQSFLNVQHLIRNSFRSDARFVKVKSARIGVGASAATHRVRRSGDHIWMQVASGGASLEMVPGTFSVSHSMIDWPPPDDNTTVNTDANDGLVIADWSYHGAYARFEFDDASFGSSAVQMRTSTFEYPLYAAAEPDWYSDRGAFGALDFGTKADESTTYGLWSWDTSKHGTIACWNNDRERTLPDTTYYPSWSNLNSSSVLEADDPWMNLLMFARTGQRNFIETARQWVRYHAWEFAWRTDGFHFQDTSPWGGADSLHRDIVEIPDESFNSVDRDYIRYNAGWTETDWGGKTDGGHIWNGGLIDYYYLTGDRDALEAAVDIAEHARQYEKVQSETAWSVGNIRTQARAYLIFLRTWEATGDTLWRGAANHERRMLLNSQRFDSTGFYFMRTYELASSPYFNGSSLFSRFPHTRFVGAWMQGLIPGAMYRDYVLDSLVLNSPNRTLQRHLLRMAEFAYRYGVQPDTGYTGAYVVIDSASVSNVRHLSGSIFERNESPWMSDPPATNAYLDALAIGYRLSHAPRYLAKLRNTWAHVSKYDGCWQPTTCALTPYAPDDAVGRWQNSLGCVSDLTPLFFANGDLSWGQYFFHDVADAGSSVDYRAPGRVTSITLGQALGRGVLIYFTAPYDTTNGGTTGPVAEYDIRFSTSPITSTTFFDATRVESTAPEEPGTQACRAVSTLNRSTHYYIAMRVLDSSGNWSALSPVVEVTTTSGNTFPECPEGGYRARPPVEDDDLPLVLEFSVPDRNPTSDGVAVAFGIPKARAGEKLDLAVFDLMGRRVWTLQHGPMKAGRYTMRWDLQTTGSTHARAGAYFLSLRLGEETRVRKLVVVR